MSLIIDFVPQSGSIVQVDCATSWATLAKESETENSDLKKLNIKVDLGRHQNKNKNPVSDNACKEFHKEILRIKPEGTILSEIERAIVTSNINQRIRKSGFSSKEICFKRDLISNDHKEVDDKVVAGDIIDERIKRHNVPSSSQAFDVYIGLNVYLRNDKSKLRARQLYRVIDVYDKDSERWATIQKHDSQFRAKKYEVKLSEIIPLPGQAVSDSPNDSVLQTRPKRKAAEKARELFSKLNSVSSDVNVINRHGWDYEKMLKYFEDEEDIYQTFAPVDEDIVIDSDSPTLESSSDDFEDANSADSSPPPVPPRLPRNLSVVQNLEQQLQIPEVQEAISPALGEIIDDLRNFNSQHPRPPPQRMTRRSARVPIKPRPLDYSVYNRTGKK